MSGNTGGDASLDKMAKAEGNEETGSSVHIAFSATQPPKPNISLIITAVAGKNLS